MEQSATRNLAYRKKNPVNRMENDKCPKCFAPFQWNDFMRIIIINDECKCHNIEVYALDKIYILSDVRLVFFFSLNICSVVLNFEIIDSTIYMAYP